ncbi:50S ribosomal protein L2 [Candidatus Roizmanbacteria bacterium]|nr:50S ribosomal protein L2 [Candidatus Roizmanbacteria bacterium]
MNSKIKPEKSLTYSFPYRAGRDAYGRVSIRHRGGRHKRLYRLIDFARSKHDVPARIASVQYDPYRGAAIALLFYRDGAKRYILAPVGLQVGDHVSAGEHAPLKVGNALPLRNMPVGTFIHNIELNPGSGGKIVRGAGNVATVLAKENGLVRVKLPSNEVRVVDERCYATVGQLSNIDRKHRVLGKAGRSRWLGIRPTVRGVAQDPRSHPHGGGEGRSGIGMPSPKSPWGKRTRGVRTRRSKASDKFIVERRK